MPRKMVRQMTLEIIEEEIFFTQAALKADPDAADLTERTAHWLGMVDTLVASERQLHQASTDADASRHIANERLDGVCLTFADDLLRACGRDRESVRFATYFPIAPSLLVRQPLGEQLHVVRGWLSSTSEATLEPYRADLTRWVQAADAAVAASHAASMQRGLLWQLREGLAKDLTAERDALHRALADRAGERALPRTWPDLFFKVATRASREARAAEPTAVNPA